MGWGAWGIYSTSFVLSAAAHSPSQEKGVNLLPRLTVVRINQRYPLALSVEDRLESTREATVPLRVLLTLWSLGVALFTLLSAGG